MSQEKYIGMDVHQATISAAVMDAHGKLLMECLLETKADTIVEFDLIPSFGTKLSMISDEGKGKRNVEEQAHGSADDRSAEAVGGWAQGGGHGERSGGIEAHDLCLEGKVRRHGCEPGAGSEATAG